MFAVTCHHVARGSSHVMSHAFEIGRSADGLFVICLQAIPGGDPMKGVA